MTIPAPPLRPRVVATRRLPELVEQELVRRFDAVLNPSDRVLEPPDLAAAVCSADALLPTVTDRIGSGLLTLPDRRVRIVANFGVGFNHIDLEAARDQGVVVTNTPGVLTDATADLTMTLLLAVARRAGEGERELRAGRWRGWSPTHLLGTQITGATLGIVGFGRIGRAVARRASAGFGMRILYTARAPVDDAGAEAPGARFRSLDDLLAESDFVSLHCPATPETDHLIDARRLALMKPDAFLINTARGSVVDQAALVRALQENRIAGAGLDVYESEPEVPQALTELENVVLLPHLGSATRATREAMGMKAVENLAAFFAGREPPDRVV